MGNTFQEAKALWPKIDYGAKNTIHSENLLNNLKINVLYFSTNFVFDRVGTALLSNVNQCVSKLSMIRKNMACKCPKVLYYIGPTRHLCPMFNVGSASQTVNQHLTLI